jgi:hypothetical protein
MIHHRDIDELDRLMGDPVKNHERIMQMLRPTLPNIIHKQYTRQPALIDDTNGNGNDHLQLLTDDLIDALAQALAETRNELRVELQAMVDTAMASLTEEVAVLQAQMNIVLSLVANNNNNNSNGNSSSKTIEASETVRKVRVRRSTSVQRNDDHQ